MHLGIKSMQKVQHSHVQIEIVYGHIPVFRHDQVEPDHARIFCGHLKSGKDLGKDRFFGKTPGDLVEIARLDGTARKGVRLAASQLIIYFLLGLVEELAGAGDDLRQAAGKKFFAHGSKIVTPANLYAQVRGCTAIRIEHQLHILKVPLSGALTDFRQHLRRVVAGGSTEFAKGSEEVVMARLRARVKLAHGESIEETAIECWVLQGGGRGGSIGGRIARWRHQGERVVIDADIIS